MSAKDFLAKNLGNEGLAVLASWVEKLKQQFPTVDLVDSDRNSITIKIRYDDVFRSIYNQIKATDPDSKVSLKQCDDDKKYGWCMYVKTKKEIVGWEQWGFGKPILYVDEGGNTYILTLEQLFNAFDYAWKTNNQGKPLRFKFQTRKLTNKDTGDVTIWHYITIEFVTVKVMGDRK